MKHALESTKPQSRKIFAVLLAVVALTSVGIASVTSAGCSLTSLVLGLVGRETYGEKELRIKTIEQQKDGTAKITFTCMADSAYSCAGANAKTTPSGVELTFMRAALGKHPKVDCPKTYLDQTSVDMQITVPSHGGALFLRDGARLVKLSPTN